MNLSKEYKILTYNKHSYYSVNGVQEEFNLPMNSPIPGSEMTREPFRWDQRLFALVLRLSGKVF